MRKLMLVSFAASILPLAAIAQTSSLPALQPASPSGFGANLATSNIDPADARFLKAASAAGLAEVQDGRLATSNGGPAVQKLGAAMVADHTKINTRLEELAMRQGVKVARALTDKETVERGKLEALTGAAFDVAYLDYQKRAHEKAIALFKAESTGGFNPDLKSFALQTIPTLQAHLQMIEAASH